MFYSYLAKIKIRQLVFEVEEGNERNQRIKEIEKNYKIARRFKIFIKIS